MGMLRFARNDSEVVVIARSGATRQSRSGRATGGAIMIGWRARLGFLVPPGNPTVEAEMIALAPAGVSLHFHRMAAGGGIPGALDNQDSRTRTMVDGLDDSVALLAMVKAVIIIVARTA